MSPILISGAFGIGALGALGIQPSYHWIETLYVISDGDRAYTWSTTISASPMPDAVTRAAVASSSSNAKKLMAVTTTDATTNADGIATVIGCGPAATFAR